MSLKIFGGPDGAPQKKAAAPSDIVGRFRSGYVANDRPVALQDWRVTSDDPTVADKVAALLGGQEPQQWETKGADNIEVFTTSASVDIILDSAKALRQAMVMYGRKGIIYVSDGETITYPEDRKGEPDPQAGEDLATRKAKAKDGTGSEPRIEVFFRLAEDPDLGVFKFQSGSWSLVSDLAYHDVEGDLADYIADSDGRGVRATLSLEEVSFTAKSGDRAGQVVSYTKPVLKIVGPVEEA